MIEMFMRFPGGKDKALTLSYDDGVQTDEELIRIMKAHGLKGTFNINSGMYAPEGTVHPQPGGDLVCYQYRGLRLCTGISAAPKLCRWEKAS